MWVRGARLQDDGVEFEQSGVIGSRAEVGRELREILAVLPERRFVKHFAQRVQIGLWTPVLRVRYNPPCHQRPRIIQVGHETCVRQLGSPPMTGCSTVHIAMAPTHSRADARAPK